jgi:hypothetical protein
MPVGRAGLIVLLLAAPLSAAHSADTCRIAVMELPLTMEGLRPLVKAKINGAEVTFVADSGAFYSMLSPAATAQLKLPTRPAPFGSYVTGVGGKGITPLIATAKAFTLSKFELTNVEFLVGGSEWGAGSAGLLGQNFLHGRDVSTTWRTA